MAEIQQQAKAILFRDYHLHKPILLLPNAWDVASARIYEEAGFRAIGTTSAGLANSLGYPDGQKLPVKELLSMAEKIVRATKVPVTVDIEAGYGLAISEILEMVKGVMDAGAVGINLEDRDSRKGTLTELSIQVSRIEAVRSLAATKGVDLTINARTDAYYIPDWESSRRFEETLIRADAYVKAGANCIFVPFINELELIRALAKAIKAPLNVLAVAGTPSVAQLEEIGVARVSVGSGPARAALALLRRISQELKEQGTYTLFTENTIPYAEVNALFEHKNGKNH